MYLLLICVGILALGYFIMRGFDRFVTALPNAETPSTSRRDALILCAPELAARATWRALTERGYLCDFTDDAAAAHSVPYRVYLALSTSDQDNLLFLTLAGRTTPEARLYAVCADALYERLYRDAGAVVLRRSANAELLESILAGPDASL